MKVLPGPSVYQMFPVNGWISSDRQLQDKFTYSSESVVDTISFRIVFRHRRSFLDPRLFNLL